MPVTQEPKTRHSKPITIYGHGILDYKYRRVFEPLGVQFYPVVFSEWVRIAWRLDNRNRDNIFHIRYLLWKGYLRTLPMYLVLISLCKIRGIPILWTCHNIWEHGIPSHFYNKILRCLVAKCSSGIVVLHKDLMIHLSGYEEKIWVACFGEFRTFLDEHPDRCPEFQVAYANWLKVRDISGPDIVFIGEYSPTKRIEDLIELCRRDPQLHALIIGPKMPELDAPANVFVFNRNVFFEAGKVLRSHTMIGYIAHDNHSMPTAVNLYASFGLPCVVYDVPPLSTIADQWGAAEKFRTIPEIGKALKKVRRNYSKYAEAAVIFSEYHTWERSQSVHLDLLRTLTQKAAQLSA